ncbi:MAG: hypothetical protein Q8922_00330 [Bacteroidota bacterium]|nr:hypothetical protein [Bacteroidota bacterium]MDP4232479.1 hypothetical protein [Bacteroidota bacterium]MDP4241614.1 hypothetical protein [Bacteroidota bacterium]MDP4286359.1 hypothetical protein [Bacteroidota bacterium]
MKQQSIIDLQSLLEMFEQESKTAGPKVTIYFSVPQSSDFGIIGRAELKGHIHTAATLLKSSSFSDEASHAVLETLRSLLQEPKLWSQRSESYAIFASPSILRYYALPLRVAENVWIGNDFRLTPLIPLLSLPEHFYLLDVSRGKPRMARIHPQFAIPISLEDVWALEESFDSEDIVHDRAFHTSAPASGEAHHGGMVPHGGSQDGDFRKREHLIQALAQAVNSALRNEHVPLVITGTEEVIAHFRKHLPYHNVLVSPNRLAVPEGNPLTLDGHLWQTCALLDSSRADVSETEGSQLEALRAQGRVTEDIDTILSLSATGGIMTLMVNEPELAAISSDPSNPDHVNAALILTLRHHGTVMSRTNFHSPTGVAALLRPAVTVNQS